MRALIAMLLLVSSATAEVPIAVNGAYGSGDGCLIYRTNGAEGDYISDFLLITPTLMQGLEYECDPTDVPGRLLCGFGGDEWTIDITVQENGNGTIDLVRDGRVTTLSRCE